MSSMDRTVAALQARTAADNAALLALAAALGPAAGVGLEKRRRGEFNPAQPRDEHGRFASTGGGRGRGKRKGKRRGPIRTFAVNAGREAGRVVGREGGRALIAASPVLAMLAANEANRRLGQWQDRREQQQRRSAWERDGTVVDGEPGPPRGARPGARPHPGAAPRRGMAGTARQAIKDRRKGTTNARFSSGAPDSAGQGRRGATRTQFYVGGSGQ